MTANVIINNASNKMYVLFKDFNSGDILLSGTIEELERENNKAYKRLKQRFIKDFYINIQSITIWV